MKTQKIISIKVVATSIMIVTLLTAASCSNQGNSSQKNRKSSESETVKPPNMDIHMAALLGDLDAINQHIKAGSDLNVREPSVGSTPLISAAVFGKTEVAIALIEAGADVNIKNNEGSTALHSAAFLCHTEIVEALLENGADKTLKNNYGNIPFETVAAPFDMVKDIYDIFSKDLGPLGLKLDYTYIEETRPIIAEMLK
jgi:uncharacterized protein